MSPTKKRLVYQIRLPFKGWQEVNQQVYLAIKPGTWVAKPIQRRILEVVFVGPEQTGPVANPEQEFLP